MTPAFRRIYWLLLGVPLLGCPPLLQKKFLSLAFMLLVQGDFPSFPFILSVHFLLRYSLRLLSFFVRSLLVV